MTGEMLKVRAWKRKGVEIELQRSRDRATKGTRPDRITQHVLIHYFADTLIHTPTHSTLNTHTRAHTHTHTSTLM